MIIAQWRFDRLGPIGSKRLKLAVGHKVGGVNITEELLADIRRMIREGLTALKIAVKTHLTDVDIRMYAKGYGESLLKQLNENEGCRTRKATPQEMKAVKDVKGNTMCSYGTGWESRY